MHTVYYSSHAVLFFQLSKVDYLLKRFFKFNQWNWKKKSIRFTEPLQSLFAVRVIGISFSLPMFLVRGAKQQIIRAICCILRMFLRKQETCSANTKKLDSFFSPLAFMRFFIYFYISRLQSPAMCVVLDACFSCSFELISSVIDPLS